MRTKRLHDLASLKEAIKSKAAEGRSIRTAARSEFGLERHNMKIKARGVGEDARDLLLAYGYLRGRSISQMESLTTDPTNRANYGAILDVAQVFFNRGPEAEPWEEEVVREHQYVTPVPDNRSMLAKMLGRPAPQPTVTHKRRVETIPAPGWDEFCAHVEADVKAWNKRCELQRLFPSGLAVAK